MRFLCFLLLVAFVAAVGVFAFQNNERVDLKFITCNIAGCGSMLREYEHLLRDDVRRDLRPADAEFADFNQPHSRIRAEG